MGEPQTLGEVLARYERISADPTTYGSTTARLARTFAEDLSRSLHGTDEAPGLVERIGKTPVVYDVGDDPAKVTADAIRETREHAVEFGSYLENYGRHHEWCDARRTTGPTVMQGQKPTPRCDCGYDGALAAVAAFHRDHPAESGRDGS